MNIFISGASGFIGSNIFNVFNTKYSVTVVKRNMLPSQVFPSDVLILAHASVQSGIDVQGSQELFDANVLYTDKLIKHFRHSKVIFLSTASIYDNSGIIQNNSEINPINSYSISKYWGENLIKNNCTEYYILRLSSVYGEGMKENTLIPNYVNQMLTKRVIEVWGEGKREQNYIHVLDVVNLIEKMIQNKENKKGVYLCVDNEEYSNFEIANFLTTNTSAEIRLVGNDYSKSLNYNNNDTKILFNWKPKVSIKNGLKSYIEWKRKQS